MTKPSIPPVGPFPDILLSMDWASTTEETIGMSLAKSGLPYACGENLIAKPSELSAKSIVFSESTHSDRLLVSAYLTRTA
eukprot:6042424-Ditylum_brightwellii.AAC.1